MKQSLLLFCMLCSFGLAAQHETLFDEFDIVGAFGGPILEIGSINGTVGANVGGGGALLINNFFLGGYGINADYPMVRVNGLDYNTRFRQGGFWLGYVHNDYKVLHLYSSVRMGWGRAQLRREGSNDFSDRHFTLTPELGLEVNLTTWFKLALTGGYRWVNGIDVLPGLNNASFSSPVGMLTFRFGGFGPSTWNWDD